MKELGNNTFYLKISKLDSLLYNILMLLSFKLTPLYCTKSYLNRRILLKLLTIYPSNLIYIEKYKRMVDYRFFGYTITYIPDVESIGLSKSDIVYIQYYDKDDREIVNKITKILTNKYHEHQRSQIKDCKEIQS